jgi:hypothetical protein
MFWPQRANAFWIQGINGAACGISSKRLSHPAQRAMGLLRLPMSGRLAQKPDGIGEQPNLVTHCSSASRHCFEDDCGSDGTSSMGRPHVRIRAGMAWGLSSGRGRAPTRLMRIVFVNQSDNFTKASLVRGLITLCRGPNDTSISWMTLRKMPYQTQPSRLPVGLEVHNL